ncbi:MAG: hypothetical protein AB8H80_16100 [Planctomycetota bacterium]
MHRTGYRATWILALLAGCAGGGGITKSTAPTEQDRAHTRMLLGTWVTEYDDAEITYRADGTCSMWMELEDEDGGMQRYESSGTWQVRDGAIHGVTERMEPPLEELPLPYVSIEKLVEVGADQYRYVCPVQDCTNTMRRVSRTAR